MKRKVERKIEWKKAQAKKPAEEKKGNDPQD
jgi:hypothetical protein